MLRKTRVIVFCVASAAQFPAQAQPPGLQGPFIPLQVVSVTPSKTETVAVLDYYAQTESYADLYAREADTFTPAEVVDLAADLIGTPWEGATCGALADAGFVEPCAIPPNVEEEPEYQHAGNCQANYGGPSYDDTTSELGACVDLVIAGSNAQYPSVPAIFNKIECVGNNYRIHIDWTGSLTNVIAGTFYPSDSADYCTVPPSEPPQGDPTTQEIYEAILPAVNQYYFYEYATQRVINNTTINSTATSITNNYTTYQSEWESGDPMTPPSLAPVPLPFIPAPPSTSPDTEPSPGCEAAPDSLGCSDASSTVSAIGASVADSLVEEVSFVDGEAAAQDAAEAITDGLQAVGDGSGAFAFDGDVFAPISGLGGLFPSSGSCQSFEYVLLPEYGMIFTIDTCDLSIARQLAEWFLYALTIFALFRIAVGQKGEQ